MRTSILVAEPVRADAEGIRRMLLDAGFGVSGVASPAGGVIRMCSENKPDLLGTAIDLNGGGDGIETAGFLRRHFRIPAVYVTPRGNEDIFARLNKNTPCGLLLKPVKARELGAATEFVPLHSGQDEEMSDGEAKNLISMCTWCKRVRHKSGVWREPKASLAERHDVELTHGICPKCRHESMKQMKSVPPGTRPRHKRVELNLRRAQPFHSSGEAQFFQTMR